jgi:hypothetical protein
MIVCIQTRQGVIHSLCHIGYSKYYTSCDKFFDKEKTFYIFVLDKIIDLICVQCRQAFLFAAENKTRNWDLTSKLIVSYKDMVEGFVKTENMYGNILERHSSKLRKYRKKLDR